MHEGSSDRSKRRIDSHQPANGLQIGVRTLWKARGLARNGSRSRPPGFSRTLGSIPVSEPEMHACLHALGGKLGAFLRGGGLTSTFTATIRPSRRWIKRATPSTQPIPAGNQCVVEGQGGARVPRATRCCVPARRTMEALLGSASAGFGSSDET